MSNTKSINIFANVVAPLAVVIVTVALFFIFMPQEPGTLFWFNMIYTAVLETLLFAYIVWLPAQQGSVALKWMCGSFTLAYICIAFTWMLLFSLSTLHDMWSLKVYFSVIAVLTVLWIFIGATTVKVDNIHETSVEALADNREKLNRVTAKADMLLERFNLKKRSHPELNQSSSAVTALCRGLATLSPTSMADASAAKRINNIISGLEEILDENVSGQMTSRLRDYAEESTIILNSIKKSIRK